MDQKPSFTKGPWRASEFWSPPLGNFEYKPEDKDANGNVFYGYSIFGRNEHGGEILPTLAAVHNFPRNIKANANLIAAAPELYKALQAASHALKSYQHGNTATDLAAGVAAFADAALARAEGRS